MKRIIVVGTTGSGKSLVANALSRKLNIPYIQMDQLFWESNWQESTDASFFPKIVAAVEGSSWVLDGNYARTNQLTWPLADTVVWIDLPFWLTFYQCFKRGLSRAITRKELWPATGNRESILRLFSKDSILIWLFKTYESNRARYLERMNDPKFAYVKFIHLKSRKDVKSFLESLV